MACSCEDWEENFDKIQGPYTFMQLTRPYMLPEDHAPKVWKFCPWCGKELPKEEENEERRSIDGGRDVGESNRPGG